MVSCKLAKAVVRNKKTKNEESGHVLDYGGFVSLGIKTKTT